MKMILRVRVLTVDECEQMRQSKPPLVRLQPLLLFWCVHPLHNAIPVRVSPKLIDDALVVL